MSKLLSQILTAATLFAASLGAHAQWQPMREVVFDSPVFRSTGSAQDRVKMEQIWAVELSRQRAQTRTQPLPAFTLTADVNVGGRNVVFSLFDASSSSLCEGAPNGYYEEDIFTVCTLRVSTWPLSNKLPVQFPGYCMIFGSASDGGRNRIEYQLQGSDIAFRAIQNGKVVDACNKTLRLQ